MARYTPEQLSQFGRPGTYVYDSSESISPYAQQQISGINTQALDKNRQEALRTGPSTWRQLMDRQIQKRESGGLDTAARQAAGATAGAQSGLAMRGGLSSGARERIAKGGATNYLNMSQDVSNQAGQAAIGADIADEQNRVGQLQQQAGADIGFGMDKAKLGINAKQFDIGQDVASTDKLNAFNMNNYNEQMRAWAAGKQADATANSGK